MNRSKKIACMFGILMMIFSFAASQSFAASCSEANVLLVGPNVAYTGNTAIQVQCVGLNSGWTAGTASISMQIHADVSDQILATALTAISLNKKVYLYATTGALNGVITGMYLKP